jgi:hypothetical protein
MNSQEQPSTDPRSGPVGSRAGDPRCRAGQWTSADLLAHYREFADSVEAALTVADLDDMARLARITVAHAQLTQDTR